jgi:hypothetical protein
VPSAKDVDVTATPSGGRRCDSDALGAAGDAASGQHSNGSNSGKLARVTSYTGFFSAAASVAGALTGLLFVALSVSPGRTRGKADTMEHQSIAATAFTALIDALFVSLGGLTPGANGTRFTSIVLAVVGLSSSTGLALRLWKARQRETLSRRWPVTLGLITVMYAAQFILAVNARTGAAADSQSVGFVLAMFAVGIARSWELLGLRGGGLLDLLAERLEARKPPQ